MGTKQELAYPRNHTEYDKSIYFCIMRQIQVRNTENIIADIKQIIEQAKEQVYSSINALMLQSNWLVGRRIVDEEQDGASRAEYGKALLKNLATELVPLYGNSYSARRLQDYRQLFIMELGMHCVEWKDWQQYSNSSRCCSNTRHPREQHSDWLPGESYWRV